MVLGQNKRGRSRWFALCVAYLLTCCIRKFNRGFCTQCVMVHDSTAAASDSYHPYWKVRGWTSQVGLNLMTHHDNNGLGFKGDLSMRTDDAHSPTFDRGSANRREVQNVVGSLSVHTLRLNHKQLRGEEWLQSEWRLKYCWRTSMESIDRHSLSFCINLALWAIGILNLFLNVSYLASYLTTEECPP